MTHEARLAAGAAAPDVALYGPEGQPLQLAGLWAERPLVLAFLRHFG